MSDASELEFFKREYLDLVEAVVDFITDENILKAMKVKRNREAFHRLREAAIIFNAGECTRAGALL